ncbi:hypothetical protein J007_06852 [Cryptococcus neoformans]|nr:hypothetical protein J007_06852 [Cryptococcus neoformans var. grubii]
MDGRHVHFKMRPSLDDSETFRCHHYTYGTNVLVIADHLCRFRLDQIGFPGSASDSCIQGNLKMFQKQEQYFSANEYILADVGFTNDIELPPCIGGQGSSRGSTWRLPRAKVECTFGIWKNRFPATQRSRTHLRNSKDQRRLHAMIISSMVLHNLLVTIGDIEEWEAQHYHDMLVNDDQRSPREGELTRKKHLVRQMMRLRGDTLDKHAPY